MILAISRDTWSQARVLELSSKVDTRVDVRTIASLRAETKGKMCAFVVLLTSVEEQSRLPSGSTVEALAGVSIPYQCVRLSREVGFATSAV